jgi:subtilase family serine protease
VDSVLQETQLCPALAPDESYSDAFEPEECPCGETLNVTVCADNDDVVDESDETNNCEVNFVDCPPCKPDLIVTDINAYHYNTISPAWFNMQNEIDVTVKNNGSAAAGASSVSLYIEDVPFGKLPVPGLDRLRP